MKLFQLFTAVTISLLFASCIGDDIIADTVPENLRISVSIDTLGVGDTYQFEAIFTNNVGQEEDTNVQWTSSNSDILQVDDQGLATGVAMGMASVTASVDLADGAGTVSDVFDLAVANRTVVAGPEIRDGELRTTSSYVLEGSFTLKKDGDDLVLSLGSNYRASSSLPGLYVYLTNNPNTTSGAYEVGRTTNFSGAHTYTIPGSEVAVDQYTHVLYFCKPFNVKVGDGAFNE
ncbi:MAG: DM13 domain-containing protein [Bacteroidota bacterium]